LCEGYSADNFKLGANVVTNLGAIGRGLSATDAEKNGTGAATVFRYVGNATELTSSPISGGQVLPAELSVLNFHGGLGQWHQGLTLSAMKRQPPKKLPETTKKKLSISIPISNNNRQPQNEQNKDIVISRKFR
jgi:hypothetical protein